MSPHRVTLHLPGQEPRLVATVEAKTPENVAAFIVRRYPFLPPAYVWVGDRALVALHAHPAHNRRQQTPGQKRRKDQLDRQRRAERWRQHWIDKADAKRRMA